MADATGRHSLEACGACASGFWWRTGIGCRVSFFMIRALILVTSIIGAFFFQVGKNDLDEEIGGRSYVYCT
jgi:hypothetical protein